MDTYILKRFAGGCVYNPTAGKCWEVGMAGKWGRLGSGDRWEVGTEDS